MMVMICVSASVCAGMWTLSYQQRLRAASHQSTSWLAGSHKVMYPLHQDAFALENLSSLICTPFRTGWRLTQDAPCSLSIHTPMPQCLLILQCAVQAVPWRYWHCARSTGLQGLLL